MSRTGKQTGFGTFLILLIISALIAGFSQAILGGLIIIVLGLTGLGIIESLLVNALVGIIIFIAIWSLLYGLFFRGRTFR
jgi:hypothetical protein